MDDRIERLLDELDTPLDERVAMRNAISDAQARSRRSHPAGHPRGRNCESGGAEMDHWYDLELWCLRM